MAEAGAVGFTDDGNGVQDPSVMLRALQYAAMFGKVVAQHCEDNAFAAGGVMNAGSVGLPAGYCPPRMIGSPSLAEPTITTLAFCDSAILSVASMPFQRSSWSLMPVVTIF